MAVFAHKIHLPNRIIHEIEKDNQSRDWFWLKGYEIDPLKKGRKKHGNNKRRLLDNGTTEEQNPENADH